MDREDQRFRVLGRAAGSNDAGRFERHTRVAEDDGWARDEVLPVLRTQTSIEVPRRVITYNRSPDLPFDRSINPYRGCEHGCVYCFARPSHAYLGLSPGLDFETQLIARPEAPDVLARELRSKRYQVAPIAIGTNTDPYQPIEKTHGIMRECLEVLAAFNHPVAIVTKGSLIERDIDILGDMAGRGLAAVGISVTTLDAKLSRLMEPRAPAPQRRLQVIRKLSEAGIPVRIMASPMIPALTDPELEAILTAGREAGARHASWIMLRLPREVSPLVQDWLATHYPDRAGRIMARLRDMHGGKEYDAGWHKRMRGEGPYAQMVAQRFDLAVKRLGLARSGVPLRCDLFRPPSEKGDQLSLF
ncbi:PA0069 family radical SAM protein [Sulfitobacter sp. KE29]|uniref:PA0069 family radical SAM protein n=1 Tax=Sulfitobacter TaxID=60136 RepID=UPI0007C22539|nr:MULTISPECIES: PA0069 family radical SAM protein [Sulfitobacter]KZY50702.1 DNA repair photolyase [Sulfitobacter sp. HI0054]MBO9437588.1 PA0069 family radical SAM protein [Sulfitobacter sp. R18_2]MDF3417229.1 PA0069 family radical SAM protein [Sulfitobacter sp. Ks38]MDF3424711.1 PA0069 family radical SAM protein [Sulfitobacter sp. KE29]MDF3428291.1 PA0069 family radical SAM protein [Sulfitobacter sp. S46]